MRKLFRYTIYLLLLILSAACSSTKYVPDGAYLLDEVHIRTDNKEVKPSNLSLYLRQTPNSKWFSLIKTQLYVYNWSGRDSTKWVNRVLRRMGDAPVIYNEKEMERTREEITKAVQNMGYMRATVTPLREVNKKKIKLTYKVATGQPYKVRSLHYDIPDEQIRTYLERDTTATLLSEGMYFDVNVLDAERQRVVSTLLQQGYYRFNKDYISYTADTVRNTFLVDLTLHLSLVKQPNGEASLPHRQYTVGKVNFVTDYNMLQSSALSNSIEVDDSLHYKGIPIYFKDKLYLRPKVLTDNLRITPGALYNAEEVQHTYSNFGRLQALKYTNIRFYEVQQNDSSLLNAYVLLTRGKQQSISFEVEGTNSAGDLGAAASVAFNHRNLFKGSEAFMVKLRGAYEAVSGLQSGLNQNYTELGAEATVNFPRFLFPFLSNDFKRKIRATTEFGLQYNYQMRPEFTRIVASGSWSYKWGVHRQRAQHRIDLLDINYLYMPWIDSQFKELYLDQDQNYILKYNYEDRLIVRAGYSYTYNSSGRSLMNNTTVGNSYTVRFNLESAGNLLYAFSKMTHQQTNENGEYTLLNIPYAQYVKMDLDYARNLQIDARNSLVFHCGLGVAIPYGNATMLPFEKRYFSGGANSVRGWSVRDLGPGSFPGDNNFMNQSGDIKLDANVEYRTRLFWKFRGALFVDAGNIWTLRNYKDQPGGQFKFNKFYKQLAVAYGLGLRLDLDFFILRFDGGMKAVNPAYTTQREHYPLIHPNFSRDFAFHFAVGYPF
ncbi:MAG: BamA/TamA family outer membrane protein [Mediterranea sp.]|nr:BamA/TamA family outer membrane protein [Mediterranea sp.]